MRLLVLVFAVAACGVPGEPIRDWTLDSTTSVRLPSNLALELPLRELDYTLSATVATGDHRTLVIPCFHGALQLAIDGKPVEDLGDAGGGEHRYAVPSGRTALLVLTAHQDNNSAIGWGTAPYLTEAPPGAPSRSAGLNHNGAMVELGLVSVFCLLYSVLYVLGRRPEDKAFVAITVFCVAAPMWQLGLLDVFGPFEQAIPGIAICGTQIGVLYFIHHSFALGPPPQWMVQLFAAIGIAELASPLAYLIEPILLVLLILVSIAFLIHVLRCIGPQMRSTAPRSGDARLLFAVMLLTALAVAPDAIGMIIGRNFFAGTHTISLGIVGCVLTQALLLSRSHVARQRELERTAEELRRQVVERSRELTAALAELARRPPDVLTADRVIAGRYRIIKRLGAGGMGTVYEVLRTHDNERLALKTLRGRAEPDAMARFTREAQIAAELSHPNLVPVLDVGIADGLLYLVMPLVVGGSLEQQRARFGEPAWAKPILAQIATGLAALHARGIVHRDLKPGNVLLAGAARIADFGLAALDEPGATAASISNDDTAAAIGATVPAGTPSPPLTRAGDIFGTPRYMAPELATGVLSAGPPSDVFAFGVLAYEMLTTRQPFRDPVVMTRMNGEPIPAPSLDPVDVSVRDIVGRCLAIDPVARPAAGELAAAFAS